MSRDTLHDNPHDHPPGWAVGAWALVLFLIWSNSFLAIGFLLGSEEVPAQLDWLGLTVARFLPVSLICLVICLGWRREETLRIVRRHWRRLVVCGLLTVPGYNFALYFGQQHGIPAPIASLETALVPLFLMLLAAAFLGERLSRRKILGFAIALVGLVLIALSKESDGKGSYPLLVATTALAPLCWAVYTVVFKPISHECSPTLWAYLSLIFGSIPLIFVAPFHGGAGLLALDVPGWSALLYLILLCTVFGNAAWGWLVKHMPASSVGFTIFLNPPLTTASKALLALLLPAVFAFRIVPLEWIGGIVALAGMAVALTGRRTRRSYPGAAPGL